MDIGVGDTHGTGEEVKSRFFHLAYIPNGAIGHSSHATKGLVDVGIDLAPEGSEYGAIDVMNHNHPWLRYLEDFFPPIQWLHAAPLGRLGCNYRRDGVANHGAQVRVHALD